MIIRRRNIGIILISLIFWLIALIHIYPILLIFISSVKTRHEMAINPFGLPSVVTFAFFSQAFEQMHYLRSFFNTALIAVVSVSGALITSSMAAYAIARKNNRFYKIVYMFFLAGLILPFQMIMIPLYKFMLNSHLIGTYQGMILLYIAGMASFSIFLLVGFVKTVPRELEESAYIDGCDVYGTFFKIVFPLLKPALATVAILNTFSVWNDFLGPLLYLQNANMMTLTVQLRNYEGMYFNNRSLIFTGVCMIVAPMLVVYIAAQKYIINGITAGAVKG